MAAESATLIADSSAPAASRAIVRDFLIREGCDRAFVADAELLSSELVANSVRHGSRSPADPIGLDLELAPGRLRVEVSDRGGGWDLVGTAASDHGGWGLILVERVADRWSAVANDPSVAWFEIDRRDRS